VRVRRPARLRHHPQLNDLLIGRGSFLTFGRSFSGHGTTAKTLGRTVQETLKPSVYSPGPAALLCSCEFQIVCTRFAYFSHETRLTSLVVALDENPHSASVLLQTNLAPACRWGLCFSANSAARPCGKTENVPEIQRVSGRNRTSR
jgi:hypothetical protein